MVSSGFDRRHWGSIAGLSLVALMVSVLLRHFSFDDLYITYRYAYNLAAGEGFVYNPDHYILGTTAPLYALLVGILSYGHPHLVPLMATLLSAGCLWATALGLYWYGRTIAQPGLGLLAGLFFMINPFSMLAFKSEFFVQAALLTWGFVWYRQHRHAWSAVALALAVLTRSDAVLAVGLVAGYEVWRTRRIPWRSFGVWCLVIGPALGAMWLYFGTPLPVTLDAKLAQRDSGVFGDFLLGCYQRMRIIAVDGTFKKGLPVLPGVMLALVGLVWALRHRSPWWLLLGWSLLYTLAYGLLNVPFYQWYYMPIVYGLCILTSIGCQVVARAVMKQFGAVSGRSWQLIGYGLLSVVVMWHINYMARWSQTLPLVQYRRYHELSSWINEHLPEDASLGYIEIGILGYETQRPIVDALGLIHDDVAPAVARGDFAWAYQHYQPDYIIHMPGFFAGNLDTFLIQPWFTQSYVERETLYFADATFVVFQRQ